MEVASAERRADFFGGGKIIKSDASLQKVSMKSKAMVLSKQKVTVLVIGMTMICVVVIKLVSSHSPGSIDPSAARAKGALKAKVDIVEFIDFECPACAGGAALLKDYLARYPQDIHVQVKYYPLMNVHHHALQAASYAECVSRQGKFWPFFDSLMSAQSQWSPLVNAQGIFDQIAASAGADRGKLKSCLSLEDVSAAIMSEKALGRSWGVQSTPTYFINKKMVVGSKSLADELNQYFPKN